MSFKVSMVASWQKHPEIPTAELHKACLCTVKTSPRVTVWFSRIRRKKKKTTTLEKNGNFSSYRDLVSLCLNRLFPHARGGRKWASRKEWGRSSHTFKQYCFSSYDAQRGTETLLYWFFPWKSICIKFLSWLCETLWTPTPWS